MPHLPADERELVQPVLRSPKRAPYSAKRALYPTKRALFSIKTHTITAVTPQQTSESWSTLLLGVPKEPYIPSKEPYTLSKEPNTLPKEPYTLSKETHISSKVP